MLPDSQERGYHPLPKMFGLLRPQRAALDRVVGHGAPAQRGLGDQGSGTSLHASTDGLRSERLEVFAH